MKKYVKRAACVMMLCVMVMLASVMAPVRVQAATKTVKKVSFTTKASKVKKKATTVKKGTTTLVGTQGWFKFTSKKTKKYTITFSNVQAPSSAYNNAYGYVYPMYARGSYLRSKKFSTMGGKTYTLYLTTQTNYDDNVKYGSTAVTASTDLPTRSTKIKIRKGQTYYFYFYFAGGPVYFNVQIK